MNLGKFLILFCTLATIDLLFGIFIGRHGSKVKASSMHRYRIIVYNMENGSEFKDTQKVLGFSCTAGYRWDTANRCYALVDDSE